MQDTVASKTALACAHMRAVHQVLDPAPRLLNDPIVLALLGCDGETIRAHADRHQTPVARALRTHVCLRTRFAEDRLAAADGTDTYVLLGAGFDTFAWRQPPWAKRLRIIEIDHPATQAYKRKRLAEAGLEAPPNLTFVAADFARQSISQILENIGLDRDRRTFFSWLGVSMYLPMDAIDATLDAISAYSADVVLTFRQRSANRRDALNDRVASQGEPFVTFFTPMQMDAKLRAHGFGAGSFLTPDRAKETYFRPPCTDLPVPGHTNIVYATKNTK